MRLLLPALAVVVGLANALVCNGFDDSPWGGPFVWNIRTGPLLTADMLSAVVAGLVVFGALLLFVDRTLRGGFFGRYVLMMAAICAGGAILSVFMHFSIILIDERGPMLQGLEDILLRFVFSAAAGGILGVFEGVYLGLPLAWLLGLLGGRAHGRQVVGGPPPRP